MLFLMLVLSLVLEEWLYVVYEVLRFSSGLRADISFDELPEHADTIALRALNLVLQGPASVDNAGPKETHVGRLHEELVPSFRNNFLEDISCIEALFQVNGVNHRDACSLASLHVPRLVQNPLVVIPHRMMSEVWIHLNLLQPLR